MGNPPSSGSQIPREDLQPAIEASASPVPILTLDIMVRRRKFVIAAVASSPTRTRYGVLLFVYLAAFITYFDRVCISVAAPAMQKDLGLSQIQFGWVFTSSISPTEYSRYPPRGLGIAGASGGC